MAYVAPSTKTTGTLITADIWNQDVVSNVLALYARDAAILLHSNSGTDANAAATTVNSVAMSGLTAKDRLLVIYALRSVTQQTAADIVLYNSTDSVILAYLNSNAALAAGARVYGQVNTQQMQHAATSVGSVGFSMRGGSDLPIDELATFTQNWTGSWTLGLRHGGVTAGGTFQYTWSVYKLLGQ